MQATQGGPGAGPVGPTGGSGLAPNVAAALCYVFGLVGGAVFLLVEKDRYVRFHALQSIFVSLAWAVVWFVLSVLGLVVLAVPGLHLLAALVQMLSTLVLGLGGLALWIALIVKAYRGEQWKLPYIGDFAERSAAPIA